MWQVNSEVFCGGGGGGGGSGVESLVTYSSAVGFSWW